MEQKNDEANIIFFHNPNLTVEVPPFWKEITQTLHNRTLVTKKARHHKDIWRLCAEERSRTTGIRN